MAQGAPATPVPVGFVGLGMMGVPIAARLRASGVPLVVSNRDRSRAASLLSAGAMWAETPRAVGRAVRGTVAFVMVTDARAVRAVVFGRTGLATGAAKGTLLVNLSTIAPDESRAVAERLAARGIRYLEAPVGGSTDAASRGELLVFAGGEASDLAEVQPLLATFARKVEHLGPVGAGASMKLVNNLVMVGTVALDAEAVTLGEALGLDRARVVDLLLEGAGQSRALLAKKDAFRRREYPALFKLALAEKDLRLAGRAAREVGVRTAFVREAKRLADEAMRAGLGESDFAVVLEAALRRRAGAATAGRPAESAGPEPSAPS